MLRLVLLALSIAATDAFAQTTAAPPSPDYSNPQAWLCRPDRLGACEVDLSTTVLVRDGRSTVERAPLNPKAPVDCFYVYPTVSTDTTTLSDLVTRRRRAWRRATAAGAVWHPVSAVRAHVPATHPRRHGSCQRRRH